MTATAFVYVDREMSDIKTILGNKMSGCGSDALGFALYVNEWNKKDGQLWLEWGDGAIGCQKVLFNDIFTCRSSIFCLCIYPAAFCDSYVYSVHRVNTQ